MSMNLIFIVEDNRCTFAAKVNPIFANDFLPGMSCPVMMCGRITNRKMVWFASYMPLESKPRYVVRPIYFRVMYPMRIRTRTIKVVDNIAIRRRSNLSGRDAIGCHQQHEYTGGILPEVSRRFIVQGPSSYFALSSLRIHRKQAM